MHYKRYMKLLRRHLSRRLFLKGGVVSSLAALGFVMGCGGGSLGRANSWPMSEVGDEGQVGDAGGVEEAGAEGGSETEGSTEKSVLSEEPVISVWRVDPLYDSDGNHMGHRNQYKELQIVAAGTLFRFDKSINGRKKCAALRKLNWQFERTFGYKPLLRRVFIRENLWDLITINSNSRVADLYSPDMKRQIIRRMNSYMQSSDVDDYEWAPKFMAWHEDEL